MTTPIPPDANANGGNSNTDTGQGNTSVGDVAPAALTPAQQAIVDRAVQDRVKRAQDAKDKEWQDKIAETTGTELEQERAKARNAESARENAERLVSEANARSSLLQESFKAKVNPDKIDQFMKLANSSYEGDPAERVTKALADFPMFAVVPQTRTASDEGAGSDEGDKGPRTTKEEFDKMGAAERASLANRDWNLYLTLSGRK